MVVLEITTGNTVCANCIRGLFCTPEDLQVQGKELNKTNGLLQLKDILQLAIFALVQGNLYDLWPTKSMSFAQ
jgi:hypothetical protein